MRNHRDEQRRNLKRLAIGSTVAAAAGYVAGILTAPKSGKATRGDIKVAADKGLAEAEKDLKLVHTELDKVMKEARAVGDKAGSKTQAELKELLAKAKDKKQKASEVISAMHNGDAEDKDLKKAAKEARTALEHLRKYLKK